MFDRHTPFNALPALPPVIEVETPAVLKKAIAASRALAELKGTAERMPNQAMLIDSLLLQEARASSEIENILTTNDELFKAASDEALPASAEAKEVLRYRQALNHGLRRIRERPLATGLFTEVAQIIKQTDVGVRSGTGTRIATSRGDTIYTPPEGQAVIRDKLRELEDFMQADEGPGSRLDVLVKMALVHYQFEAIHPFADGNGRTGRILNLLYLVDRGLLNLPVLYLSRHIVDHKAAYHDGLRRVTEEGAWCEWVIYLLDAVEQTSLRTRQQMTNILALMETVRSRVQRESPGVYSKDLIEQIFRQPYCRIQSLERAGLGTRQTCAKYLRELERLGVLEAQKTGREVYFINRALFDILTQGSRDMLKFGSIFNTSDRPVRLNDRRGGNIRTPPMRQLSSSGQRLVDDIAQRQGFSIDATMAMLDAVIAGNGGMAQFSHPEFSGSGQWMRGGMTMVSDMFNHQLKNRVDALCSDLAGLVASQPDLVRSDSFQSQRQGDGGGQAQTTRHDAAAPQHQDGAGSNSGSSNPAGLFVPGTSGDWWPSDLRHPNSTGAQNGVRYAYFAQARRLVIDVDGTVTVYDTLDHRIGGFSQQQSAGATLSFSSQHGLVDVASLPVLSSNGRPPEATAPRQPPADGGSDRPAAATASHDVFAMIERLADLKAKGIVSDEEFSRKKAELLSRM